MMQVTMISAGILGILMIVLGLRVSGLRRSGQVSLGDGGNVELMRRIRAHANFAEWAPMGLVLLLLAELAVGSNWFVGIAGGALVLGRLLHAIGMRSGNPNPARVIGTILTLSAIGTTSIVLLLEAIGRCETCGVG